MSTTFQVRFWEIQHKKNRRRPTVFGGSPNTESTQSGLRTRHRRVVGAQP